MKTKSIIAALAASWFSDCAKIMLLTPLAALCWKPLGKRPIAQQKLKVLFTHV